MDEKCECIICKNNKTFDMPKNIINAAKEENLVVFCGAGISTENRNVLCTTLYDEIKAEINCNNELSFSELLSEYCRLPSGRINFVKKILSRFAYISSFPEIEWFATRFHREISTFPQINTIITTNWDDYFEKYCGATPFVYAEDIPLWDSSERRVLKIHGSITNISSLVATKEDYNKCFQKLSSGVLSAKLIDLLITKTVVFIGFSFSDEDFQQILTLISEETKTFMPHLYIVTLDNGIVDKMGAFCFTPIITDGTYFIETLKKHLVEDGSLVDDSHYDFEPLVHERIVKFHNIISGEDYKQYPLNIYSLMYQDGFIHALERFENNKTGIYYDKFYLYRSAKSYEMALRKTKKRKQYLDEAYVEGYLSGLAMLLMGNERIEHCPLFFLPECNEDIITIDKYKEQIEKLKDVDDKFMKVAKNVSSQLDCGIEIHHPPHF